MLSRRDLLVLCLGLPLLLASWAAFIFFSRDDLDRQLRELAGPNAVDCGVLVRSGVIEENTIQTCAVQAFSRKQPFFYRVASAPVPGQTLTSLGTVMTPKKEMFLLSAEEATWENWLGRVTGKMPLYNPRIVSADGVAVIAFDNVPKPKPKSAPVKKVPPATTASPPPTIDEPVTTDSSPRRR